MLSLSKSSIKEIVRANAPVETVRYLSSVIPPNRLDFLANKCRETLLQVPGNVLEVGTYRGGSLSRLAEVLMEICPEYRVIGIDTFTGHPYSDGHPVHPKGKYSDVDLQQLRCAIDEYKWGAQVELHKGRVEEILSSLDIKEIAFAHIDCDLYLPVRYCALEIPPLMKKGGLIYFDDYGHEHCPGATRAVREVFPEQALNEVSMPDDGTCWSCYFDPNRLGE